MFLYLDYSIYLLFLIHLISVLDDLDIGETLTEKEARSKRAICIEFDQNDYDKANKLINEVRNSGGNVGKFILKSFENDR